MAGEYLVEKFGVDPYANRPGQYLIDHFGVDPSIATQQAEQPARQPIPLAPPPSPANPFARPAPLGQVSQPTARVQQAQRMQQTQQAQQALQDTFTRTSPSQSYLERTAMSGELDDLIGKRREYLMDLNQQMLKEDRYNPYELVNAPTPYDDVIEAKTKELEGVGGRPGAERAGYWAKSVWNSLIGSVGMAKHFVSAASFEYAQNRLNPEWIEKDKQYKAAQKEYDKWRTQHQLKMETPMSGEEVKADEDIGKQLEMKLASAKKSRDDIGVKITPNEKFIETMRRASADPRGVDYEKFASDKPLGTIPFKPDAKEPEPSDKETSYDWFRRGQEQMALAVKDLPEQDTFYVQVGASAAQNVVLYSLALISPSIPLTVMSTSAAGRYMMELSDRGISSQEALARGIVSGAIEYMTESLPLEVLASVVSKNRPLLEAILKMAGTEAAEEGIAAILNYIADLAANDPAAELSLEELLLEMYGGAVSGLFLGGFYSSLGKVYSGLTGKRANVGKIKNLDLLIDKMSGEQLSDADNQLATKAGEELARQLDVLLSESEGSIASMSDLVNEDGTPKTMEQLLGDYGKAEAADAQAIHDDEDYSQIYKFKRDRDSQAEAKDYEALRELPQVKRTPIPIREAQPDNLIKPIPMVSDQATIDRLGKLLPSSDIFTIPTANIKVAPSTYQFKSDVDASGTTKLLKNVEVFDKNKAGVILVHQRNNGDIYVVNGHHRLELARRLRVPDLDVRVIRESDGVSVEEARRVGALMNIAEGRGTPLDADKIFREGNLTASELKKHGVSLTESLVQKGYGLSKLNSDVHSAVLNGMLSEDHGAMIGNAFENDPARQTIAYKTVKRIEASGKNVNNQMVQQAINITKAAEISSGDIEQYNLFGGDEATSGDTKMDLVAKVTQELERIKRTFAPLTSKDKTQRISEVGNVLDNAKNRRIHKNATENLQNIEKFAYYVDTGIGTLFNEYANLVFNGEMTEAQAVSEIVSELGDVSYAEGQSRHGQGRQADARDIAAAKRAPESREGRQAAELPKTERSSEAAAQAQEIRKRLSDFVKENNLKVSESDIENIMFSISDSVDAGFLNRVAKRFGVNIEVAPIGVADAEGYYDRARNTIVLSPGSVQADVVRGVVLHELTHFAESSGRYAELKAFVVEQMPNFGRQVQAKIEQYKRSDVVLTQRQAGAEVVADYVRNTLFADPAAVEKLVSEKPGAARQLYDAIVRMIEKLKAVVTGAEIDQLEQGRLLFEKALESADMRSDTIKADRLYSLQDSVAARQELAAQTFGLTNDYREAGYLLLNGRMLDFSGKRDGGPKGTRNMDHREITAIFRENNGYSAQMIKFMNEGNIRLSDRHGIDLGPVEPTARQYEALGKFINNQLQRHGYLALDTSNEVGDSIASMEYEGNVTSGKIISDIKYFYKFGDLPNKSATAQYRYSLDQSDLDKVRAEYQRLLKEYGAIKPGESPTRDVEIPKRSSPEQKVRQTVRTFAESEHMTDEMAPALEKRIVDGALSYTVMDDALAVDYADDVLSSRGYEGALALWDAIAQIEKTAGKKQIVLGERLFIEAARRGDSAQALDILAQVAVEATNAGQAIQAIRIIKRMGKEGQLLTLQQAVNKINRNTEQRRNRKMTPEQRNEVRDLKKKMPKDQGKAAENLKKQIAKISGELYIPQPVLDNIMAAKTKAELDIAINDAYVQIAKQVQSTWIDKWNALRYFSMLANPRTHIRNIVGNAVFYPARQLKNTVKLALEKAPGYKGERTAAWLTKADQPLLDYAKAQYLEIEGELRSSGKMNPSDRIRDNVQVFKSSFLENARKLNFEALEVEDAWFLRNAFVSSMAQYLKANSIDINALKSGSKLAQKSEQRAISYAMQEAWKATYRDASAAATALNNLSRSGKVAGVVVEGIIPFKKTPLNIVKRGVEYSPIGLLRGIYNLSFAVDQGKVTAAEALDQFASGMSGSAIMTLGMLLASMGFLTGAGDEEDKQRSFDKLHGDQLYALKLGDKSYTIDWAAPTVMPLFAGAEIIRMAKTEGKFTATQWINALTTITEPIVNLSMMEGVEMAINAAAYGEFSPFTDIIINAATSYVSQAIPTALGQVARTIDPVRRDTYYTDKTSGIPRFAQRTAARTASRIPFASKALPRKIDAWGRETASGGRFETVIENFLSPGYYNVSNITAVDKEIQRLYDITGEPVFPTSPAKYFTQDGARVYLSAKDYERISIADGRKAFELLDQLIGLREYNALNDEDKAKLVQRVYDLSGAFGKNSIDKDVGYQKWMEQALSPPRGITTAEWLVLYQQHGSRLTSEKAQEAEKTIGVRNYLVLAEGLDNWRAERYELSLKVGSITAAEYQELSARGATQEEAQAYLDGLSIGQEEKAVMWSLINSGWKTNPYETTWPPKLPKLPKLEKLPKLPKLTG